MSRSPGHQKFPEHKVTEVPLHQRMQVRLNDEVLADSSDVIEVREDKNPPRCYFPRADVTMGRLERSQTTSECPFKGVAHYFHLRSGGQLLDDAAWSYEDPYDEHAALKNRVAFYEEKLSGLSIGPAAGPAT